MDTGMHFETTMRLLFGEKAYQIAGTEANPKHRREWLQRAVRELLCTINTLDTTPRHKQMLMTELEVIADLLKGAKEASWELVYRFLRLSSRLIGFDYVQGARCHTPVYYQSSNQYFTSQILDGGDPMQDYYDKKNAISVRQSIVKDLKAKGFDDFKISLVLNTTEYEVKKLRSNPDVPNVGAPVR
jgi:hypothetical protein